MLSMVESRSLVQLKNWKSFVLLEGTILFERNVYLLKKIEGIKT